jgi:hypothetical protein
MQLRETSDRRQPSRTVDAGSTFAPLALVSTPGTSDAASSCGGLLDIARALLFHLQLCGDCPERDYFILNACVVRLDAALAAGTYPYLLDSCAHDLAAQISRIQTGGFPCSARRLRRVG